MSRYSDQIVRRTVGPCTVLVLPTAIRDVVSLRVSFDTWPDFAGGHETTQEVVAALLDRGTLRRDRFEIATALEDRGARLAFRGAGTRIRCSARMLSGDEPLVVGLLGEMLAQPAFDGSELEKAVHRMTGAVRRAATDTAHRAAVPLARHAFGADHPNHMPEPDEELAALAAIDVDAVRAFHSAHVGGPVLLVAVGDVDVAGLLESVAAAFEEWPARGPSTRAYRDPAAAEPGEQRIVLPDRPNLDVRMGHAVGLRRDHPDYDALRLGVFVLGGNFSARLMSRIRDEKGLTYGIGSSLSGVSTRYGGLWRTAVTLSADRLEEGIEATRAELAEFVYGGVTDSEVDEMRQTLAGRFAVSLATTGGLADALLSAEERGFGVEYLDTYEDRMAAVTRADVDGAARRWLDPERLFVAVAGSTASGA